MRINYITLRLSADRGPCSTLSLTTLIRLENAAFSKTLIKPEEFENAGFVFLQVDADNKFRSVDRALVAKY